MHLVVIAWLYVALMMAVAEATNTTGTVLGAVFTFLLYGLAPVALVVYLMTTPARRRALREREEAEREAAMRAGASASVAPDAGSETPADAVPPVREKE
jgi:membrane protein implicated in regulation of membrane protease activity